MNMDEGDEIRKCYVSTITNLLVSCCDIELLEIILKLLEKSM